VAVAELVEAVAMDVRGLVRVPQELWAGDGIEQL
jgi:hypothetical protein